MPPQPQPTPAAPPAPAPVPPHASEATRLLCAGTYLDSGYRDRVIEELHLNEQRIVAPSLGFDAARVLAHALRARRLELAWAGAILGLWVIGAALTGGLLALFLVPIVYLAVASWIRGRAAYPPLYRRVPAFVLRWCGRALFALLLVLTAAVAFGVLNKDSSGGSSSGSSDSGLYGGGGGSGFSGSPSASDVLVPSSDSVDSLIDPWQAWVTFTMFALIALCVAAQRGQFARVLGAELSPQRFPDAASDPAEQAEGLRFGRLKDRIRLEQHSPLIMYNEARPFRGAGSAYQTWVLAVEMRPDKTKKQQPIGNRVVLEKIRPLIEQLRLPAEYAGQLGRDRLRRLEIDECVFLPAEGIRRRDEAPYHPRAFEEHRARAVEEGAEKRRHFLRIRVGGWEEELVVTVFVRIHTQGRMLTLEVAPHVLTPVREDFKNADRTAHRFRHNNVLGKAAWAVARVPGSVAGSLVTLGRGLLYVWRLLTGGYARALPDGPDLSVRELGSVALGSDFQEMDVRRYLKNVQDRVANGVRVALAESGYLTGEFMQKITTINNNGDVTNIARVENSTFAVGSHATASSTTFSTNGGAAPQTGPGSDGH